MTIHSRTIAWKILWTEEPGRLQLMGVAKSRTQLSDCTSLYHGQDRLLGSVFLSPDIRKQGGKYGLCLTDD